MLVGACCTSALSSAEPTAHDISPPAWRLLTERTCARMHEMDEIIRDRDPQRSFEAYMNIFSPDIIAHGLYETGPADFDGLRAHYRPVFFELRDGVLLSDEVIVAGNMAAQRYHSLLYLDGEFDGVQASAHPVFLRGQTFFRFDSANRIAERWSNHDHEFRLTQLKGEAGRAEGVRLSRILNGPGLDAPVVNEKLAELIRAWNRMENPAARARQFFDFFASDVIVHGINGGLPGLHATVTQLWAAFPDMQVTADTTLSVWSMGAIRWRAMGSHRGEFRGMAATLRPVTLRGEAILRFNPGGSITEAWINLQPIQFHQ